jgi:hypothetical protein
MICSQCGYMGQPKLYTKGNIFLEILLWFLFLLPGLIYSIWRHMSRFKGCPKCGAPYMVPLDSPRGRQFIEKFA